MNADLVASWLQRKGIKHAFGIVGGGNVFLWDAITRLGFTELVSCHHEQAAVMAAGYYWRTSGRIALALVTSGAGSTNALTGVMACWMDSVAVLVISGNENKKALNGNTRVLGTQGFHSTKIASHMVKYTASPSLSIINALDRALDLALEPRQGPVWIDLAKDVQNAA